MNRTLAALSVLALFGLFGWAMIAAGRAWAWAARDPARFWWHGKRGARAMAWAALLLVALYAYQPFER